MQQSLNSIQLNPETERLLFSVQLARITFLSYSEKIILEKNLDSFDSLALLSIEDIEKIIDRRISKKAVWNGKENYRMAVAAVQRCLRMQIKILTHSDDDYPEILRQISDPPFVLYCRGDTSVLKKCSVSVVGTRKLSPAGKQAALDFSYDAALSGVNVISGLANGADGCAHQGALNAYFDQLEKGLDTSAIGKTIAVLPSAIDEIVPFGHKKLAEQILKTGGLLVSEYEPALPITKWHFVGRNRIIAGLSPATLVVEAPAGSGSLITADFALENGRDVMFHEAAFGEMAKSVSSGVKNQLEKDFAAGRASKYKIENTPEKFLEAGAPVVKNYKDYCEALSEVPGKRNAEFVQGKLFD